MRQAKYKKGLTVALQEEMYIKIRKITDQQGISMAEWVREMAEKALSDNDSQRCAVKSNETS